MKTQELMTMIKVVSRKVAPNQINKLRIEESMLVECVSNPAYSLEEKREFFDRINEINKEQLVILGGSVNVTVIADCKDGQGQGKL